MNKLTDKLIIFIFCMTIYIPGASTIYMVVPILMAVICSALSSYLEDDRIILGIFIIFSISCFFKPILSNFIPLICYDVLIIKYKWVWVIALTPLVTDINQHFSLSSSLIIVFIFVAYLLKSRTVSLQSIKKEYYSLRDNTKEVSMQLVKKNEALMEKQDYEINLATLNERNRIARDIHDNVGHMLSRSILQIGALLAINKDGETKESLGLIKDTISEAMDCIRNSVHDLHEDSIDLKTEIQKLINNFKFCPVEFNYDIESNLEKNLKYSFITITKEALSNIINHSKATMVTVIMREHPAIYQLVIHDNGIESSYISETGIGLKNITDRVAAAGGNVNISTDKGFRIFISIPKGKLF
jgi:signal transduction histidine kinase